MRQFHSYGPVDCESHFCVERAQIIEQCMHQLIGHPEKGGHYFTIWAPRQNGKTWIIKQCVENIKTIHSDSFIVLDLSMQSYADSDKEDANEIFFKTWKHLFSRKLKVDIGEINQWQDWLKQFELNNNLFDKPLILIIDEFDKLPRTIIDQVVSMFRDMYLTREEYCLHGLALVGVRAVLGVDSKKGSPFNVQRSLHIPNLTFDEVKQMFDD
jgi:predicted AAA+ superfamily ATPase